MSAKSRMKVEWKGGVDGLWLVTGGKLEASIEVEDLDALNGCAASALGEIVPARQRFFVYRAITCLLGYMDREKLPQVIENAIKATWASEGEKFIGYREN
ncbi:hypothetical protein R1flu_010974 [Riccia fluitans]|uniref:Uncharacterized protein n=1 Tax=Riccia fluitans TaxID=41844 RepID=A0ABD1Z9M0_9MARC